MNKLYEFFYNKEYTKLAKEANSIGLTINSVDIFSKYVKKKTWEQIIYSAMLVMVAGFVIYSIIFR